jgi:hypothetical protein
MHGAKTRSRAKMLPGGKGSAEAIRASGVIDDGDGCGQSWLSSVAVVRQAGCWLAVGRQFEFAGVMCLLLWPDSQFAAAGENSAVQLVDHILGVADLDLKFGDA